MSTKTWKSWTPEEDAVLRKHWKDQVPTKRLATRFPGRSPGAVIRHGYGLGLGRRECGREQFSAVWEGVKCVLADGKARTSAEIAKMLKVTSHAVHECMRKRHGTEVHVGAYAKVSAHATRVRSWKLGPGPDVPLPPKRTKNEINREYSRQMRKDPEYCARQSVMARMRYAEQRGNLVRPSEAAAWLAAVPQHDGPALRTEDFRAPSASSHLPATVFPRAGLSLLTGTTP